MTNTSTTASVAAIVAGFSDEVLTSVHFTNTGAGAVRDQQGNLREVTVEEQAFIAAVRAEFRRRFGR